MAMSSDNSGDKFKEAGSLYRAGQYKEALSILEELNRKYPHQKEVMHAAALCLEKMGKTQQALQVCDDLIAMHHDDRAQAIKERLSTPTPSDMNGTGIEGLDILLDFDLDQPARRPGSPPIPPSAQGGAAWPWVAGLVVGGLAIAVAGGAMNAWWEVHWSSLPSDLHKASLTSLGMLVGTRWFVWWMFASTCGVFGGYFSLRIVGGLTYGSFSDNIKDMFKTSAFCIRSQLLSYPIALFESRGFAYGLGSLVVG